jgi:hypothetical protein
VRDEAPGSTITGVGTVKARENRLRRAAARQNLKLRKNGRRDPQAAGYGLWWLEDNHGRRVTGSDLTLEQVETYLETPAGGRPAPPRVWMPVSEALRSPVVSTQDKLAIGAACIEEEALMRTAVLMAGKARAPEWYVLHGGRFRFGGDDQLMIQVPVPPPPPAVTI